MCIWFNTLLADDKLECALGLIREASAKHSNDDISDGKAPQKPFADIGFMGRSDGAALFASLDCDDVWGVHSNEMEELDTLSQVLLMAAGLEGNYLEQFFVPPAGLGMAFGDYWAILASRVRLIWYASDLLPDEHVAAIEGSLTLPGVSLDTPGMVSYARSPADRYNPAKRVKTTLGRWFKRQAGMELDSDLAVKLSALLGGSSLWEFELTSDVYQAYQDVKVDSCMVGKRYPRMYDDLPGCQCIKARRLGTGSWTARALIWDGKWVDRIYPDSAVEFFKEYGKSRGWVFLQSNSAGSSWTDGKRITKMVGGKPGDGWPYLDTLGYLHFRDGEFLISNSRAGYIAELDKTDGGPDVGQCSECGDWCAELQVGDLCQSCYDNLPTCHACHETISDGDDVTLGNDTYCDHCAGNRFECADCECVTLNRHMVEIDGRELCSDCADEYTLCAGCEKHFPNGEVDEVDGENYCADCKPDEPEEEEEEKELVTVVQEVEGGENVG